jgi:hypothetical protein
MTSLGTDFEKHAYWQGYTEDHLSPVNLVMHFPGDGDLDANHHKVIAPAAMEFVARKTCTIASGKVQGIHWNRIKYKERCGNPPEAVIGQTTINLDLQVWKSLEDSLPKCSCADLAVAYVMQETVSLSLMCKRKV